MTMQVTASTQINLLIILFTVAFGIPVLRYIWLFYKERIEPPLVALYSAVRKRMKQGDGTGEGGGKKKKGKAKSAAKVAPKASDV
jgi:hypothetical protein